MDQNNLNVWVLLNLSYDVELGGALVGELGEMSWLGGGFGSGVKGKGWDEQG